MTIQELVVGLQAVVNRLHQEQNNFGDPPFVVAHERKKFTTMAALNQSGVFHRGLMVLVRRDPLTRHISFEKPDELPHVSRINSRLGRLTRLRSHGAPP